MKVTFINPNFMNRKSHDALEPLVFAILSALTPPDVERVLYDERVESIPFDESTDLVALSVQTFTAKRAYAIAADYKKRGIPVVMGGVHPSLVTHEARTYADVVAIGEAENIWPRIIEDARHKKLKPLYTSANSEPLISTKYDRNIFKGKKYKFLKPVQFGRGCRFHCDFCSIHKLYKGGIKNRKVSDVIEEIATLSSSYLFFIDDNLFANHKEFSLLMKEMAGLKKRFACQISVDVAHNDKTLSLLQKAGCIVVFLGLESMDRTNLDQMKKKVNYKWNFDNVITRFQNHGIMVIGSFVFGYDHDSDMSIQKAYEFAMKQKLCSAHFNMIFPFPGTALYERFEKEKKLIFKKWWLDEDEYSNCLFYPKNIKPDRLKVICQATRKKFNSIPSIIYRSFHFPSNARNIRNYFTYWAVNMVSRNEIINKLTMKLG